jgi:hypothetical protein
LHVVASAGAIGTLTRSPSFGLSDSINYHYPANQPIDPMKKIGPITKQVHGYWRNAQDAIENHMRLANLRRQIHKRCIKEKKKRSLTLEGNKKD